MVDLYKKTNLNYTSNGDIIVHATTCTHKFKENEVYLEVPITDDSGWEYVDYDDVIGVWDNGKKKFFRIYNVIKSTYKIVAYCRPLFYDLINSILINKSITNKNGQDSLADILTGTGFTAHSDITTINNLSYLRKNIIEALVGDDEGSFINVFGGELYVENWDIYINNRVGSDTGVTVEFGYNLEEIEYDINTDEVCTRIIPVGADGITLNGDQPWISSANLNKYPYPRTRVIEFSDVKVKENPNDTEGFDTLELAQAELVKRCQDLFTQGIDQPSANFKISMINLANTTAYEDIEPLVSVSGGDTVTVNCEHLGISGLKVRVIDYEKDLLAQEYISIELGDSISNFLHSQVDIQHRVNNITNDNGTVKADRLQGAIDGLQTQFKTTLDVAQKQDVFAFLFEDRDAASPTFGALAIGTQGFQIANGFLPGTTNWNWRTAGNGNGLVANEITTGILDASLIKANLLQDVTGKTWINMEDGTFSFGGGKVAFDGNNATFDFTGTGVATQNDVNTAKTELRQDYQNAVVTVSAQGFNVKNGAFSLTNANGDVIIDGTSRIFKIKHVFERQYTAPQNAPEFRSNFVHGLGYVPVYLAYQVDTVSTAGDRTNTLLPADTIRRNTTNNTLETVAKIRCNADEQNIIVQYLRADLNQPNTFKVKFFVLEERLL